MPESHRRTCPSCGSKDLYATTTGANGGQGPTLLPRLGAIFRSAKFNLYLCGNCGHVSFFADQASLESLDRSGQGKWKQRSW